MPIRTVLVQLDIDNFEPALLSFAESVRERFDAHLIGLGACDLQSSLISPEGAMMIGDLIAEEHTRIDQGLARLSEAFAAATLGSGNAEWRTVLDAPTRAVAREARAADLVITASPKGRLSYARNLDLGDAVLATGRPVLVAAEGATRLETGTILVGWKDTRESRRAVSDALPFLTAAKQVIVTTLGDPDRADQRESLDDVLAYLTRHGCKAGVEFHKSGGDDGARLQELATHMQAEMVVTGAFGHNRLREWAFGGVTRTLLSAKGVSRFLSN